MTYTRRTRLAAAVAGAVMLTATAACGSDDKDDKSGEGSSDSFADQSMEEIQKAALKDMGALDSVRMAGTFTNDGSEMTLDLQLNTSGTCAGSIAMDGAEAEIIALGEESYLKGTEEFWAQSVGEGGPEAEAIIDMIGDKWAKVPAEGGFTEVCDLDKFLESLEDSDETDSPEDEGKVVGETEVDGTPAIEITSEEDGEKTTVWVGSEEDKHYILKMEVAGGDEPGDFTFSEFDEPVDVEAPPKDEIVDLENLAG